MPKIINKINVPNIMAKQKKSIGRARRMMKAEIAKDCSPLTPFDSGALNKSVIPSAHNEDRYMVWNTPYARFLFGGKVMVDKITKSAWAKKFSSKILTNKDLRFRGGPTRGADWFGKAKRVNLEKWLRIFAKGVK